jgi:transcriptional regulator with XRE-family HTH domain
MMPDDLLAIFGENLKSARLKSGLKQSDVAERTGLTQQRLSLIEAGNQNLTLKTMMRLAQVVDHNVSAMLVKVQARRKKSDTPS